MNGKKLGSDENALDPSLFLLDNEFIDEPEENHSENQQSSEGSDTIYTRITYSKNSFKRLRRIRKKSTSQTRQIKKESKKNQEGNLSTQYQYHRIERKIQGS